MNVVTLIGHLGANPEAKKLDSGRMLCRLSVATNKRWTQDGEKKSAPTGIVSLPFPKLIGPKSARLHFSGR
jgi:hypothetical protein